MKYLVLIICLSFCIVGSSQSSKRNLNKTYFKLQSGLIYDLTPKDYFSSIPEELIASTNFLIDNSRYESNPRTDFLGFGSFNLGVAVFNDNFIQEFEFEVVVYDYLPEIKYYYLVPFQNLKEIENVDDWRKERSSFELKYFRSVKSIIGKRTRIFLGPTGSLMYLKNEISSPFIERFPVREYCFCLGIGVKTDLMLRLVERFYLNISTNITLIDFGFRNEYVENPRYKREDRKFHSDIDFKLLRQQFQLNVGF